MGERARIGRSSLLQSSCIRGENKRKKRFCQPKYSSRRGLKRAFQASPEKGVLGEAWICYDTGNIIFMKKNSTLLMVGLAVLILAGLIGTAIWQNNKPSIYQEFAQCLNDEGAKVYVAWWCQHCENQEADFGSAWDELEVIECSSPGSHTFDLCPDLTSSPTWETADGDRYEGRRTFENLSEIYGCELPEDHS